MRNIIRSIQGRILPGVIVFAAVGIFAFLLKGRNEPAGSLERPMAIVPSPHDIPNSESVRVPEEDSFMAPRVREKKVQVVLPSERVLDDSILLRNWILSRSDKQMAQLVGSVSLDKYVLQVVQSLESQVEDSSDGSPQTHAFLAQVNEMIVRNRR